MHRPILQIALPWFAAALPLMAHAGTDACTLRTAVQVAAAVGGAVGGKGTEMKAASVGDDACYFVIADQAGLFVKKGTVSFKVAVYAKLPVEQKEAMELKLAKEVAAKL